VHLVALIGGERGKRFGIGGLLDSGEVVDRARDDVFRGRKVQPSGRRWGARAIEGRKGRELG